MPGYIKNPPDAKALMVSARSFGNYDLAGALADLIDNSIKAQAEKVSLFCLYNDGDPEIRVLDNGHGMSQSELYNAMRPANTNPLEERSPDDLGRFGWGMKSASFSQCSKLTVISHKNGEINGASWDLADIDDWKMKVLTETEISKICSAELLKSSGTEIIWNRCDRLSEAGNINSDEFNELISYAHNKIAMIFHRFINENKGTKKLNIKINGHNIPEFDPFYSKHDATQVWPSETLAVSHNSSIKVQPYILPHYSKLKTHEQLELEGEEGLVRNQGFYVYRNNRLIIYGTWFRLAKFGELSQLVRISVDLPNSLDEMWKITIDKSDAQLPSFLRRRLKQVVDKLKSRSSKVFRSKGGKIDNQNLQNLWIRHIRNGEVRYLINREHPLILSLFKKTGDKSPVYAVLKAIEDNFPVEAFTSDIGKNTNEINQAELNRNEFMKFLKAAIPSLLIEVNGNTSALKKMLKSTEPFYSNWTITQEFLKQEGINQ